VVLEFSAWVASGSSSIDLIRFDRARQDRRVRVMIRPMSGLQALGEEMGRRWLPTAALKG
jgi:hypothetical protein